MGRQVVPTPYRVALDFANLIADKESKKSDAQKGVHLLVLLFRVGSPVVGSLLCLLTVSLHTLHALSCEVLG